MEVWKEHLERNQDHYIEKLRQAAFEVFQKYTPQYVNNSKIELHLDKL
jgi:septum formation topological specificity factor MinE